MTRLSMIVAVAASLLVVAGCGGGSSKPPSSTAQSSNAAAVSAAGLRTLASVLGRPIYWAGPRRGVLYELNQSRTGNVVVRYLPKGERPGVPKPFLSVGTYPVRHAFAVTQAASRRPGAKQLRAAGNAVAFYYAKNPRSVYFAYPGSAYQIEVFDPDPALARRLVRSGGVVPVSGSSTVTSTKVAASVADLRRRVGRLGRPVYWVGAEPGARYELVETPYGRVFVRYLRRGLKPSARKQVLAVGTYELPNAYLVTLAAAARKDATRVHVNRGAVAFFRNAHPTSVYVAYRGLGYQIEVYDPSPGRARRLVASGKVAVVG